MLQEIQNRTPAWLISAIAYVSVALMVLLTALPAWAEPEPPDSVTEILEGAATSVQSQITALLPAVLGVAIFLLVIRVSWKFFKNFTR